MFKKESRKHEIVTWLTSHKIPTFQSNIPPPSSGTKWVVWGCMQSGYLGKLQWIWSTRSLERGKETAWYRNGEQEMCGQEKGLISNQNNFRCSRGMEYEKITLFTFYVSPVIKKFWSLLRSIILIFPVYCWLRMGSQFHAPPVT
jgi:hypothetical protein